MFCKELLLDPGGQGKLWTSNTIPSPLWICIIIYV